MKYCLFSKLKKYQNISISLLTKQMLGPTSNNLKLELQINTWTSCAIFLWQYASIFQTQKFKIWSRLQKSVLCSLSDYHLFSWKKSNHF